MEISYYLLRNISLDKISIELSEDVEVESLIEFVRQTQNIKKIFSKDSNITIINPLKTKHVPCKKYLVVYGK